MKIGEVMNKYAYYLVSDIHLEKKNKEKKNFLFDSVNDVIEKNKKEGKKTIIVFSGDIDNGTKAYEWFEKIDAQIIYTAGNHEFWGNDYYETIDNLKKNNPSNVHFLHNDFVECGDYLFVGSTMWTDVGKSLNEDLKYVSNGIMNDNNYITAKKWYTIKNTSKLKEIVPGNYFDVIKNKCEWNILVEQEENEKTIQFFKDFSIVRDNMFKLKEEFELADERLNGKYNVIKKEEYDSIHESIHFNNFTYKEWLLNCKKFHLLGYGNISEQMIEGVTNEQERIFKKLSQMNYDKKLIIVSHHLPFLEERLIGYSPFASDSQKLINLKADSPIYNVRNGLTDYPHHNYFFRISKGEFGRDESILESIHYSNNGAVNLPVVLYNKVEAWCHGHDHTLNYQDYVKGVNIITNPLSYSLGILNFSEKRVCLTEEYKNYHNIETDDEEQKKIEELKDLILKPMEINKLKNKNNMIKLWIFHLMDKENIGSLLEGFMQNNKKFFTYLAKNPQFGIGEINEKQQQKIQEFSFANYYYYNELNKQLDLLDVAYAVRKDELFSYSVKANKTYEKEITSYFFGENAKYNISVKEYNKEILENYGYDHLSSELFKNIYHLNKGLKNMRYLESILSQFENINSISELYNKELPDLYLKEPKQDIMLSQNLEGKRKKIMDKYMTEEIKKIKEEQYRIKFNF